MKNGAYLFFPTVLGLRSPVIHETKLPKHVLPLSYHASDLLDLLDLLELLELLDLLELLELLELLDLLELLIQSYYGSLTTVVLLR